MIPKVIHYCWFGGNPLDQKALACIESWKQFFPDYTIIQWNEQNFDISQMPFMQEAYNAGKWAFVSDVARLIVVYDHGGLYFDTDVEVIQSYDDILCEPVKTFFGFEKDGYINSGLGFGAEKGAPILKTIIEQYKKLNFTEYVNNLSEIACPVITTKLFFKDGLRICDEKQVLMETVFYPSEYFSPIDYSTGKLYKTNKTHSIHWYAASWHDVQQKKNQEKIRRFRRLFGMKAGDMLYGILTCMKNEGIVNYISSRLKKVIMNK